MKFYDRFAERRWEEFVNSGCFNISSLKLALKWADKMEEVLTLADQLPPNLSERLPPPDGTCYAARAALDVGMLEVERTAFNEVVAALSETWLYGGRLTSNLYLMEHGWTTVAELVWKDLQSIPMGSVGDRLRERGCTISPWEKETFPVRDVYSRNLKNPEALDETLVVAGARPRYPSTFQSTVRMHQLVKGAKNILFEGDSLEAVQAQADRVLAKLGILPTKENTDEYVLDAKVWLDPQRVREEIAMCRDISRVLGAPTNPFWTCSMSTHKGPISENATAVYLDGTKSILAWYPVYDTEFRPTGLNRQDLR